MRYVRDQTGRFAERPHYEPKELDLLFERIVVEFLRARRGKVEFPILTDDLTVLIEQDTEDLDLYADLDGYGVGVEGVTEFRPGRKPTVKISQSLGASDGRENRLRTTLAHEYGHVQLHGHLFAMTAPGASLLDGEDKPGIIACKRDTMISAARTDWMEWQAGYACGAILMPASHVRSAVQNYRQQSGLYGPVPASTLHGQSMIELVVDRFHVSRDAGRVRLSVLGLLGTAPATGALPF